MVTGYKQRTEGESIRGGFVQHTLLDAEKKYKQISQTLILDDESTGSVYLALCLDRAQPS